MSVVDRRRGSGKGKRKGNGKRKGKGNGPHREGKGKESRVVMPEGDWREVRKGRRRGEIEERRGKGSRGEGGGGKDWNRQRVENERGEEWKSRKEFKNKCSEEGRR